MNECSNVSSFTPNVNADCTLLRRCGRTHCIDFFPGVYYQTESPEGRIDAASVHVVARTLS